jgi:hypothetical protein
MSEPAAQLSEAKKYDILLVSQSNALDERIHFVADAFGYNHIKLNTADSASDSLENVPVRFIVLDSSSAENQNDVVGHLQVLRYMFPASYILVVFPKRFDKDTLQWIRKSGANAVMSEGEFLEHGRFDFFVSQYVGTDYVPVKHGDFKLGSRIELPLFYFMSANRKYFPIVGAQSTLDESRLDKIKKIGDVYIRRADVDAYQRYLQANEDQSAKGLIRRCRVQFNQFRQAYLELVNHLTEQAEGSTYEDGKKRLEECQRLSSDLITSMMSAGSVFDVISQSVDGDFNTMDRAPERAAMVGFFSVMGDIGNSEKAILAALLADVGMLTMPYGFLHQLRERGLDFKDPKFKEQFESHPKLSLNCAAQKKIQLDPVVRDAIMYSHSRLDERGFPIVRPEKIGVEAQLVHFVQLLDDHCMVHWGKPRPIYNEELKKLLKEHHTFGVLSPSVIQALKGIC